MAAASTGHRAALSARAAATFGRAPVRVAFARHAPRDAPMLRPGPSAPGFVQLLRWMRSPARSFEGLAAEWGDAFTGRSPLFGTTVNFSHPDALKQIFTGDPAVFHA